MAEYLIDSAFVNSLTHHNGDDKNMCIICLDKMEETKTTLSCQHSFHYECILRSFLLSKERLCPYCRKPYTKMTYQGGQFVKHFHQDLNEVDKKNLQPLTDNDIKELTLGQEIFIIKNAYEEVVGKYAGQTNCYIYYTIMDAPCKLRARKNFCFIKKVLKE
jgi:hypothetical protein